MIPDGTVYRAGRNGKVWHWRIESSYGPSSACSGWPLSGGPRPAVSVRIEDRCIAKGCAVRWNAWLSATVRAALADQAQILAVELRRHHYPASAA